MATLYVDFKNGDDTATGGTLDPLKSLTHCFASHANNGDTILLRGGDTPTEYHLSRPTVTQNNIAIRPDTGHHPVIVSTHEYTAWALTGGTTKVYETAYTAAVCWGAWNGSTKLATAASVAACEAANNSRYFDDANNLLYVNIGGAAPTSIEVYDIANDYAMTVTGTGLTLQDLTFRYEMQAVDIRAGGSTIDGCTFENWVGFSATQTTFGMVQITGANHAISGCVFDDLAAKSTICIGGIAGVSGIAITDTETRGGNYGVWIAAGAGHTISDCTIASAATYGIYLSGTAAATISGSTLHDSVTANVYSEASGVIAVSDCTVYNTPVNNAFGIRILGEVSISDCTIYECVQDAIEFNTGTVQRVTARNCGHGGIVSNNGGTINHCVVYLDRATSSSPTGFCYGFVIHPSAVTAAIYHCVVFGLSLSALGNKYAFYWDTDGTVTVENCIAAHCGTGFHQTVTHTPVSLTLDYNRVHANDINYTECSAGAHDAIADPLFLSETAGAEDFHLAAGSPCIDAGVEIAGINDGTGGSTRFLGTAPDIGRYEKTPASRRYIPAGPRLIP